MHPLSTAEAPRNLDVTADLANDPAIDRARALLTAELDMLALPTPTLRLVDLDESRDGLDASTVDRVLVARYLLATRVVHVTLPLAGDEVLPAEFRARIEAPAPATALLTRAGWQPHREQDDDELAALFLATLEDCAKVGQGLRWSMDLRQGRFSLDWSMQVVAHAADACQLIVRTAPTGPEGNRVGFGVFLDQLRVIEDLVQSWYAPFALPLGVARDCLALANLPEGRSVPLSRSVVPPELRDEVVVTIEDDDEESVDEGLSEDITELATDAWTVIPLYENELSDEPTVPEGGPAEFEVELTGALEALEESGAESAGPGVDAVAEADVGDWEFDGGDLSEEPPVAGDGDLDGDLEDGEEFEDDDDSDMAEAVLVDEDDDDSDMTGAVAETPAATPAGGDEALPVAAEAEARPAADPPRPAVAAVASLLVPGLGQVMSGQRGRGGWILLAAVVTLGVGGLLNVYAAIDAYRVARAAGEAKGRTR